MLFIKIYICEFSQAKLNKYNKVFKSAIAISIAAFLSLAL